MSRGASGGYWRTVLFSCGHLDGVIIWCTDATRAQAHAAALEGKECNACRVGHLEAQARARGESE